MSHSKSFNVTNFLKLKAARGVKNLLNKLARVEFYEIQRWDPGKIYMKWQFSYKEGFYFK